MVFGLFKKNSGGGDDLTQYADVVVVKLKKSAYYADARDALIKTINQALEDSPTGKVVIEMSAVKQFTSCLLYTSDAADDLTRVDTRARLLIANNNTPE